MRINSKFCIFMSSCMKKILNPIFILLCFTGMLHAQAPKVVGDCIVTYQITTSVSNKPAATGTKTLYISGRDLRADVCGSTFTQTTFYNSSKEEYTVLKSIGSSKYMIKYDRERWSEQNKIYDGMQVKANEPSDKTILNYRCKKATATLKNGTTIIYYYTPDLMPLVTENPNQYKNIPGFILGYELNDTKKKITCEALTISFSPVPAAKFAIPDTGYRMLDTVEEK